MVDFIEPLELEKLFINVFAGDATYFTSLAIFVIIGLSAMFRMTGLTLGFMLFVFLLMFSGYVPPSLLVFVSIFAGLFVGIVFSKISKN